MKKKLEKIVSQILGPLKERRDYVPLSKDVLEQNAEILKKKKKFPKELEDFFKNRKTSYSKENEIGLDTLESIHEYNPMFSFNDLSSKLIVNAIMNEVAIIKRCPKKNLTDERPESEQQWCLFDSEGERLLGRHPTKQKALQQERAIQIHKIQ